MGVAGRLDVLRVVSIDGVAGDHRAIRQEGLDSRAAVAEDGVVGDKDFACVVRIGVEDDAFAVFDHACAVGGNELGVVVGDVAADDDVGSGRRIQILRCRDGNAAASVCRPVSVVVNDVVEDLNIVGSPGVDSAAAFVIDCVVLDRDMVGQRNRGGRRDRYAVSVKLRASAAVSGRRGRQVIARGVADDGEALDVNVGSFDVDAAPATGAVDDWRLSRGRLEGDGGARGAAGRDIDKVPAKRTGIGPVHDLDGVARLHEIRGSLKARQRSC